MNQDSIEQPFQVDLRGVVDLLSRHIYSSPQVFLRELLQNGVDAVAARKLLSRDNGGQTAPEGLLEIETDGVTLTVRDNGVGLTLDEATQLLATVGRSSKRDSVLNMRRDDFLGQFGIGLLSCFLIADHIRVVSRSAAGSQPVEWIGSTEGSFKLRTLEDGTRENSEIPVGTTVQLTARSTEAAILAPENIRRLAAHFGEYLQLRITVNGSPINKRAVFIDPNSSDDDLAELGTELLGAAPLDWIHIDIPGTGTRGIAYLLPAAPPPSAHQANRVYLGRMLLGERIDSLLPDWAFFVRCILDTDGLQPTASREQFVEDASLDFTREELGKTLKRWIVQLATTQPRRFDQFLAVHQLSLRALSLHDDDLAAVIVPWLSVETAAGRMPFRTLLKELKAGSTVRYTETTDEFRQIAAVVPDGMPVVNGGYAYESELIRRLPDLNPDVHVERIRVAEVLDELAAPALADREATAELERRAEAALTEASCKVSVRSFNPDNLPALYVADPEVLRRIERSKAADVAPSFWAGIMANVDEQLGAENRAGGKTKDAADGEGLLRSRLCLNWANPLARELASVTDEVVFDRTVRLLYVQAMLEGHRPLAAADRKMLSGSLSDLIRLSVSPDFGSLA